MTDDIDYTLLASYLAGECSAEEVAHVRAWIAASPEHADVFREFEAVWRTTRRGAVAWDADTAWSKVRQDFYAQPRLTLTPSKAGEPRTTTARRGAARFLRTRSVLWAAAIGALVAGASVVVLDRLERVPAERGVPAPMREVATAKGQRTSVRLSDGTRVLLSVDSRLRVPRVFGAGGRDVMLEGEAFFDVAHDSTRPFVIHAAGTVTRVLGTKFSLRAYATDSVVRVAVAEGRVRLRPERADSSAGAVLIRNQLGRLGRDGQVSVRRDVDVQRAMNWVNGRIVFDNASLHDVLAELEHWYDTDLVLTDPSLDSLRFTAAFRQEPLDVIVRAIARTLDLEWQRAGSAVVFSRRLRDDR